MGLFGLGGKNLLDEVKSCMDRENYAAAASAAAA